MELVTGEAALAPLGGIGEELGGYKGYGYATVVEVLSAALQAGSFLKMLTGKKDGKNVPYRLGHFFLAIDTEAFLGLEQFKKTAGDIMRALRNSQKAPDQERIYVAGEKEYEVWLQRKDSGVPINDAVQKEFMELRDEFNLDYTFPWEKE
jgi:LDH2 family malate/lactate/ureidoglycolate dehydrogenase